MIRFRLCEGHRSCVLTAAYLHCRHPSSVPHHMHAPHAGAALVWAWCPTRPYAAAPTYGALARFSQSTDIDVSPDSVATQTAPRLEVPEAAWACATGCLHVPSTIGMCKEECNIREIEMFTTVSNGCIVPRVRTCVPHWANTPHRPIPPATMLTLEYACTVMVRAQVQFCSVPTPCFSPARSPPNSSTNFAGTASEPSAVCIHMLA